MNKKSIPPLLTIFLMELILICSCSNQQTLSPASSTTVPTPISEIMDRSWLTDQPCHAPCWYDLTPGTSTMAMARENASQLAFINSDKIIVKGNSLFLYCRQPEQELCANLYFKNQILSKIWMNVNSPVSLIEVVNSIGPPDFLSYKPITPSKKPASDCFLELFWINRQMTVRYYDYDSNDMCNEIKQSGNKPSPDYLVQEVWYLTPDNFIDLDVDDNCFPWTGFVGD